MKRIKNVLLLMIFTLLMTDCREPFMPDFETGQNDFLVVEGFIHVGQNAVTTIKLSRIAPLSEPDPVYENNATILIEDKNGTQYPLTGRGSGNYQSGPLDLDTSAEYRLLITTDTDNQYASDFTPAREAPAIDSVYWKRLGTFFQVYVSTHDPNKNTSYYKWDFTETWEIESDYRSKYEYSNGVMTPRSREELYTCWTSALPQDLRFASTKQLDIDAIHYPLLYFPLYSPRTSVKYSILVEQRALTKSEFEFVELIQKNSTVTGSLFDPMPSQIKGNIRALAGSKEIAIGYIGASTSTSKRIFVTSEEFGVGTFAKCKTTSVEEDSYGAYFGSGALIPIDLGAGGVMLGAPPPCMDCRLRGTPNKPSFWE